MRKKIGFFGGTFDPIHVGHLNLAQQILDKKELDEVWFCPARTNPFKIGKETVSIEHRLKMVQLALEEKKYFKAIEIEKNRQGPSYTIDSIRELYKTYPDFQFYLILSEESAKELHIWKEVDALIKLAPPLVGNRGHYPMSSDDSDIVRIIKTGLVKTKKIDISSTKLRDKLKMNLDCNRYIPKKVLDYIHKNRLYLNT